MTGIEPNASWKTLGRVMNINDGPESGLMPTEKAAGNIMSPASIATSMSINAIWQAVFERLALRLK